MVSISILNIDDEHSFEFLYEITIAEEYDLNSISAILKKVVSVVSDIKEKISDILNRHDYIQFVNANKKKLYHKLSNYKYIDLREVYIFKPMGLVSPYIEFLTTIQAVQEDLLSIDERVLTPYLKWSGEVLNNPRALKRLNVNKEIFFLNVKKYNKYLDKHFNVNSNNDTSKFGNLFHSSKQMLDVINLFNKIADKQNNLSAKELLKKIDNITKRSEMLVRRCQISNDPELFSIASKKVIADVLYDIGTEITLYSRLSYNITSIQTALSDSVEKIFSLG